MIGRVPPPGFPELPDDPFEVPACLATGTVQYCEDLVLLPRMRQHAAHNGEGAYGDGGDALVLGVGDDAAHLVCVVELDGTGLIVVVVRMLQRVNLGQEAHGRVVEESAYYGGALDEPISCELSVESPALLLL